MQGRFVTRIDTKSKPGGAVDVKIAEGNLMGAWRWHQAIQAPFIANDPRRLFDHDWHWPGLLLWTSAAERALGRRAVFFQVNATLKSGGALPIAQMIVSDGYTYFPRNEDQCVLLWYVAAAPEQALAHHGFPPDLRLLKPLVDTAIQFSALRGYKGRLVLHAASCGDGPADQKLYDIYGKGLGLAVYDGPLGKISYARANDGRYFYADEKHALDFAQALDYLR